MALDAANARIFGSDDDKVLVGPLGTTLPTALAAPDAALLDVGWLHSDGLPFTPTDSIEKLRGHQGGKVVRTTITESDLNFQFMALETNQVTFPLQHNVTSSSVATGVATVNMSAGRLILARAFVLDLFDKDDPGIHYRYIIPRGEIGERSEFAHVNSDITTYTFPVEVIDSYTLITNDPEIVALATP
jgi:hypothetical protein